jgi:hypothetical protein
LLGQGSVEGNTNSDRWPFSTIETQTARYQQVYDASQFSQATNGGWIYQFYFRVDSQTGYQFHATLTNVEIHLSTTTKNSGTLSPVFSENVGADDTVVFSGPLHMFSVFSPFNQPQCWCIPVSFRLFPYNPAVGNLLMDVFVREGGSVFDRPPPFDAATPPAGGVSRVYADSVSATSGINDSLGLVTLVNIAHIPSLFAFQSNPGTKTNKIVIGWPTQPSNFVLQTSSSLFTNAVWQTVTNSGGAIADFQEYQIPVVSSASRGFYRLILEQKP